MLTCNNGFLDSLTCTNSAGRPPVWLMRQAGRCLPAYRELRKKHSILTQFRTPELIAQVTRMPIDLLGVDAAILYTDILTVLDALGLRWDIVPGKGPLVETVDTPEKVDRLQLRPACEALDYVFEGMALMDLDVPLIGFCGAPFTLACYLVEGKGSRDFKKVKRWIATDPASFHRLLKKLTAAVTDFVQCQVASGAQAIQIFESWGHLLSPSAFHDFSLPYFEKIIHAVDVPTIAFSRGHHAERLAQIEPNVIGLDWTNDLLEMRRRLPSSIGLQGNLDPTLLLGSRETIQREALALLEGMRDEPGYIFNLGHGILPETPYESVAYLVDLVRNFS